MSRYKPLPEGSARLLRLLPHSDDHPGIRCQLFACPILSSESNHPYEALSYVWGSENDRRTLYIDNYEVSVTANLHAALSHLQDRYMERIIWIDAICINQEDNDEKGQQVQSMAKIYAKASRVLVWLGEATDNSDQALKEILKAANQQHTDPSVILKPAINDPNQQAIITLLRRPWFQRIWVVQEVAAARHVIIKCGLIELDGQAFCVGLGALKPYTFLPGLQSLIRSVIYMMVGTAFRPVYELRPSPRFSLNIRPLGELINIYHTHKATNIVDKVYALLGMSSDDPGAAGLTANYDASWGKVFKTLVKFCISDRITVSTWDDNEVAVIKGKGCILGEVCSIKNDDMRNGIQTMGISFRFALPWRVCDSEYIPAVVGSETDFEDEFEDKHEDDSDYESIYERTSHTTFDAPAKLIQVGDLICLLEGASRPMIIRLCKNFSIIIMIALPGLDDLPASWASLETFCQNLLLVWDWGESHGRSQGTNNYEYFISSPEAPRCLITKCQCIYLLERAARLWNFGLLLNRLEIYKEAGNKFLEAAKEYRVAITLRSGKSACLDHSPWPEREEEEALETISNLFIKDNGADMKAYQKKYGQGPLLWAVKKGHEAIVRLLLDSGADTNAQDNLYRVPLWVAAMNGHETVFRLLLDRGAFISERYIYHGTVLLWASERGHETMVSLLLNKGASMDAKDNYSRSPVLKAAVNGHEAIVRLFLHKGTTIDVSDMEILEHLIRARANGHKALAQLVIDKCFAVTERDDFDETTFLWAVCVGDETTVQLMLNKYRSVEKGALGIQRALAYAAKYGHETVVRLLLIEGATVDYFERNTPLYLAVANGHETVVRLLLAKGAAIEEKHNQDSALCIAARNGHATVVKLLLSKGAYIEGKEERMYSPLSIAAQAGHEAVVRTLASEGAFLKGRSYASSPLQLAALYGHEAIVRFLVAKGAVITGGRESGFFGFSALYMAAQKSNEAIVQFLISKGVVTDEKDDYGRTMLFVAAENDHEAVVQLLISKGAAIDEQDKDSRTPLYMAAEKNHAAIVQLLVSKGAATNVKDRRGRTPLFAAVENDHEEIVQLLVGKGAATNEKDYRGRTPLFVAAENSYETAVQLLVDKGAAIDLKDKWKRTPLFVAAENGHEAVVQALVSGGAAIDEKNLWGHTPLFIAARNGHEVIVQLLVSKGAAIDEKDDYNTTPVYTAAKRGHEAVVRLLLDEGAAAWTTDENGDHHFQPVDGKDYEAVVQRLMGRG